jgi:hypothetical protein
MVDVGPVADDFPNDAAVPVGVMLNHGNRFASNDCRQKLFRP